MTIDDWTQLVFSIEYRFKLSSDGRVWVWWKPVERHEPGCTVSLSNDRQSVHFWGAVSYNGFLLLVKAPERCSSEHYTQLLQTSEIQNVLNLGLNFVDDKAHIHRAKVVGDWKQENGIAAVPWPAHSPHLNPIENFWAYIKSQLKKIDLYGNFRDGSSGHWEHDTD